MPARVVFMIINRESCILARTLSGFSSDTATGDDADDDKGSVSHHGSDGK